MVTERVSRLKVTDIPCSEKKDADGGPLYRCVRYVREALAKAIYGITVVFSVLTSECMVEHGAKGSERESLLKC